MNPSPPAYMAPPDAQQGQPAPMSGPVIYVGAPPLQTYPYTHSPRVYDNYLSKQSRVLGAIMIVAGILCIIFNAVSIGLGGVISIIAYGIWGGIWFIITGSFGVSAAEMKTKCKVVTFMVLCIISSVVALVVLILGAISAGIISAPSYYYNSPCSGRYYYNNGYYQYYQNTSPSSKCQAIIAMEAMQAILAGIVGIASIWGSVLCCKVACCCSSTGQVLSQPQFVPMQGNPQVFFYSQQQQGGQYVPYPGAYPVQMQSGYPAPMTMNSGVGMLNSGYVNHSMNPSSPGAYNHASGGSSHPPGGFHNAETAPPTYDGDKGGMHANI